MRQGKRRPRRFFATLVWSVIPALALAAVASYVGLALDRHVYPPVIPVEGRSMNPLLKFGDLVFLKKPDFKHLGKGDVIAFRTTSDVQQKWNVPGSYVHRIVAVQVGAYGKQFQTKGDNVHGKDPFWTVEQNVIGVYTGKVSGAGYPILFFRSQQGKLLVGGALLILFLYWLIGLFERRRAADAVNVRNLATIVEEARRVTQRLDEVLLPNENAPPNVQLRRPEPTSQTVATADPEIKETMRELVGAVGEYGQHLRSHTAVMQGLAATTAELQGATMQMREAITEGQRSPSTVVPEMPDLKRGFRGYSRKAVKNLYLQMATDLDQTRRAVERLERDNDAIRHDREVLEGKLAEATRLHESLTASLNAAEQRIHEVEATSLRLPTVQPQGTGQGHILASMAVGALERLARRFGKNL